MRNPRVEVVPQTRRLFRDALVLYSDHSDKDWSLTDCASFVIMDERHFEQKGYIALLRKDT
jgi:uncharacterized protein